MPKGFKPINQENRGRSKSLGKNKKGEKAPRFKSENWKFAPQLDPTQFLGECKNIIFDGIEQVSNSFVHSSLTLSSLHIRLIYTSSMMQVRKLTL